MRPAPLVLVLVALAAAVGVGWLVVDTCRTERPAGRSEPRAERIGQVSVSLAPTTAMPTDADEPGAITPEESESSASGESPSGSRGSRDTIRGRVVGAPAELRGHLEVVATPLDVARFASTALCDSEDRFELTGLTRGTTYHLRAFAAGRASFGRARTEVRNARPGDRAVELPYLHEPVLVFQVADARTGLPLSDFEVRIGRSFLRPLLDEQGRVRQSFPAGVVRWTHWVDEELRGPLHLSVLARGYRELLREDVLVPLDGTLDLGRILLEPLPRLVVSVVEEGSGMQVSGALVVLARPDRPASFFDEGIDPHAGRTDPGGRIVLTSFPGEAALLWVRHAAYAEQQSELLLSLAEEQHVTVRLTPR